MLLVFLRKMKLYMNLITHLGEQNNSFHKVITVRASRNLITHLWDEQGNHVEKEGQIKRVAVSFY
jgi:hypothetical protein